MGIEFISKNRGAIRQRWTREARRAAVPDLFTTHPECTTRTVIAEVGDGTRISPREKLVAQCDGERLVFLRDMVPVATNANPPADVHKAIRERGCAVAEATKIYEKSGTVEVQIKE